MAKERDIYGFRIGGVVEPNVKLIKEKPIRSRKVKGRNLSVVKPDTTEETPTVVI